MKIAFQRPVTLAWRPASRGARTAIAVACLMSIGTVSAVGQSRNRPPAAGRRSRPPAGAWDRATTDAFLPDAFSTLEGPRPTFASGAASRVEAGAAADPAAASVRWSALVSADTLVDEIKDTKSAIEAACGKAGDFKGGGFEQAGAGFGAVALAFGVIAAYDGDVRWKKDAATARDLFAHASSACAVGSDQAWAEARARLADLAAMLDGDAPAGRPERSSDFRWSAAAGRPALMVRLEQARDAMRPAIAAPTDFGRRRGELLHAVEMVAVIGEVIQQPGFTDHDDDTYRGYSSAMRDAAVDARAACAHDDYEAARAAVGRIEKACADCHADYRG